MYFAIPHTLVSISLTPLGRFLSILVILYYTTIDLWYGMAICLLVILYYQADFVEGMSNMMNPNLLQSLDFRPSSSPSSLVLAKPLTNPSQASRSNESWDIFDWISPSPEEASAYDINA